MQPADDAADALEAARNDAPGLLGGQASLVDRGADQGRVKLDVSTANLREFFDFLIYYLAEPRKLPLEGVVMLGQGGHHQLKRAEHCRLHNPAGQRVLPPESLRVTEAVRCIDLTDDGDTSQVVVIESVRFGDLFNDHPGETPRYVGDESVGEVLAPGPLIEPEVTLLSDCSSRALVDHLDPLGARQLSSVVATEVLVQVWIRPP